MCLCFYNTLLLILPRFKSSVMNNGEGKREREEEEEEGTFYFSQKSKIILTGTEIANCWLKTGENIPPTAIALENALSVWGLIVWHFKQYPEAYKIYLVVCFGLTLTTFFLYLDLEKRERGRGWLKKEWETKLK